MKDQKGIKLVPEQVCIVHPATRPNGSPFECRKPYYVEIIKSKMKLTNGKTPPLSTSIPNRHTVLINYYLLSRLEVIGTEKSHGRKLVDQRFK